VFSYDVRLKLKLEFCFPTRSEKNGRFLVC
jgi:hypothetical protein